MKKQNLSRTHFGIISLAVIASAFSIEAIAQQTTNYLTKFSTPPSVVNSSIFDNGSSIGIGTIFPNEQLEIFKSVQPSIRIGDGQNVLSFGSTMTEMSSLKFYHHYNTLIGAKIYTIKDFTGSRSWGGTDLRFAVSNTGNNSIADAMTIMYNGNVGIGTTNPLMKLDTRGANAKAATAAFTNIFSVASNDVASPLTLQMGIKTDATVGNRYGAIEVDDAGTKRNLSLQPIGGNVGIGTSIPSQKLEINHNDYYGGISLNRNNATIATNEIKFKKQNVQKWGIGNDIYQNGNQNFYIVDNVAGITRFIIDAVGGITTSVKHSGDYGYGIVCKVDGATSTNMYRTKALAVQNNVGDDQFIVWGDGMVHAREFKVTVGSFTHSDYVFADNYNLMPLNDLKLFLKKNKHLPGVPSTAEVQKNNGINLGEMTEKNLAKTEELYLYILQLNETIGKLQNENKELQSRIQKLEQK